MKTKKINIRSLFTGLVRFLLGSVFVFSGAVKAIDPMGMSYKLDAYLKYWDVSFSTDFFTIAAAMGLAIVEFMLGIQLLLGMRARTTVFGIFLLMLTMTGLTAYIYMYNPVPDCGCFGDAIVLTNRDTFIKNIILLLMSLWLLRFGLRPTRLISEHTQWLTSLYSFFFVFLLGIYALLMLPPLDFLPYKVGTNIKTAMQGEYFSEFIYEKNGEEKSFMSDSLPDSTWTFLSVNTVVVKEPATPNFLLLKGEEDVTEEVLSDTSYVFLLTLPNLSQADDATNGVINDIFDYCRYKGYNFYALIATGEDNVFNQWKDRTGAVYEALTSHPEEIKSLVRSNPGLMLLKSGVVMEKWSSSNFPNLEDENIEIASLLPKESFEKTFAHTIIVSFLWFVLPLLLIIMLDRIWASYKSKYNNINNNQKSKTMRKKIVAGNWKMNLNLQDGKALATELKSALAADAPNCDVVICTPFIHLAPVAEILEGSVIGLGAENCADKVSGAYTGEVSAEMVKSTGAQYVILGHSERRAYYGETAAILKEKTNLALANGLKVIFCIGEVLEERESGRQNEVVKEQLEGSLFELSADELKNVILAYEPVWAIGTGKTATAEQAEDMHAFIRGVIADKFGVQAAEEISILYGGSCKPSNAKEIFAKPNVDGGLIGGAALKCADFKGIIDAWK